MNHLILLSLALAAGPADFTAEELKRAEAGEVLIESRPLEGGGVTATARGVIAAPIDDVWALIDRCDDYATTMPRIASSKELSRKGTTIRCEIEADLPWPVPNLHGVTEAEHTVTETTRKRAWKLVSGDYKKNSGYWLLKTHADGKQTIAVYVIELEPDLPVPDSILAKAQSTTLPALFKGLGEQARK